ncbi:hypothetical protein G6514_001918 [Epicoccum nigrum]|nr:hypothetical protein G6514_001918 [Epicoccum nigrum]
MQAPPETQTDAESKDRFFTYFRHEVTALQEQMDRLGDTAPGNSNSDRNDAVDRCLAGIDRLSHEVKDASSYLPAYDQRTYSEAIKALSEKLQKTRASLQPARKFAFKSRSKPAAAGPPSTNPPTNPSSAPTTTTTTPTPPDRPPSPKRAKQEAAAAAPPRSLDISPAAPTIAITGHTDLSLAVPAATPATATHRTATLTHLTHCTLDLAPATTHSPLAALYLRDTTHSAIATGRVAGAVHATSLAQCTLFVATRQFRMHGARGVDVYLHCASRPIVEGCVGVRFAPLPNTLRTLWGVGEGEEAGGGEGGEANLWDQVDDFGWLRAEPSPNWGVLPEGERVQGLSEVVGRDEEL